MQLKPLSDYLLVKPIEEETVTASGIVLPDTMDKKEKIRRGEVVAAGPGKTLESGAVMPLAITVGTKIMYKEDWSAEKIKVDGEELVVIRESEAIMIIE